MIDTSKQVGNLVKKKINWLCETASESSSKALMANLRRGIGKPPGSVVELWEVTFSGLPESFFGLGKPSYEEWAIHMSLTLFALHQQGKDLENKLMFQEGESLGKAARMLVEDEDDEKRIKRRFDAIATAQSMEELANHLRGMIQLLKSKDIPIDYRALAQDLFQFQLAGTRDAVRLRWGQDFYRMYEKGTDESQAIDKE